nr:ALKBH3 [Crypthecodinium cohnii]
MQDWCRSQPPQFYRTSGPRKLKSEGNKSLEPSPLPERERGRRRKRKKKRKRRRKPSEASVSDEDPVRKAETAAKNRFEASLQLAEEPSREEEPLELMVDRVRDRQAWTLVLDSPRLRSWLALRPRHDSIFEEDLQTVVKRVLWKELVAGKDERERVTRKTAWLVRDGCQCGYKYGKELVSPSTFPPWMEDMMARWLNCFHFEREGLPNCVNLNLYEDEGHSVGWHADDEKLFAGAKCDACIISVSLGATRCFRAALRQVERTGPKKRRRPRPEKKTSIAFDLNHGDICTMEGRFQKHFLHQIRRGPDREPMPRVNATFRWIVKHGPECPCRLKDSQETSDEDEDEADEESDSSDSGSSGEHMP